MSYDELNAASSILVFVFFVVFVFVDQISGVPSMFRLPVSTGAPDLVNKKKQTKQ